MKRVHFIGSGFESVKSVYVNAETNGKAIEVEPYEYGKAGV